MGDTKISTRYMNHGGAMVPDPEGQWVHVGDVSGIREWNLDPATLDAIARYAALVEAAQGYLYALDMEREANPMDLDAHTNAWAAQHEMEVALRAALIEEARNG